MMISYSQNFEDVVLNRVFLNQPFGFYIDVGAHHPVNGNDTKTFYDRGWKGINIEPDPAAFNLLINARPRDFNHQIITGSDNSTREFYLVTPSGLSTADPDIAEYYINQHGHDVQKVIKDVMTLDYIIEKDFPDQTIDFLKIDVEGTELEVLKGLSLDKIMPKIIVCESIHPVTGERNDQDIQLHLKSFDYEFAVFNGVNSFYVSPKYTEWKESLVIPPNVFDRFVLHESVSYARLLKENIDTLKKQIQDDRKEEKADDKKNAR